MFQNRKKCCFVRKIEPLQRALDELDIWITGLRMSQSVTREDLKVIEFDDVIISEDAPENSIFGT